MHFGPPCQGRAEKSEFVAALETECPAKALITSKGYNVANTRNPQDVKPFTSDGADRSNLMTRDEFLHRVLHSGEITRVGQHLALVIFLVAEGKNQLGLSVREIEKITGWSRQTISDHLSELEVFMRVTFGKGRAKTLFELQGVIEDALASAVASGSRTYPRLTQNVAAKQADATVLVASQPDTTVVASQVDTRSLVVSQIDTRSIVASRVAAGLLASQIATTPIMASQVDANIDTNPVVASQIDTTGLAAKQIDATGLYRERESNISIDLSSLSYTTPREEEADDIQLNGVAIYGPGFKVSYAAIDQAAMLIGMPSDRARAIAEICARDWAANKKAPGSPMAVIKRAMKSDVNEGQIQDVRLEKARADAKPKESRAARLLRHVEEAAEKGGRS